MGTQAELDQRMQQYERETTAEWALDVLDRYTMISRKALKQVEFQLKTNIPCWFDLSAILPGSEEDVEPAKEYLEWRLLLVQKGDTPYYRYTPRTGPLGELVEENVEAKPTDTLTLGELIQRIEELQGGCTVQFDALFGKFPAGRIYSSRGDYSHLALEHSPKAGSVLDSDLLRMLQMSVLRLFEGYKGGSYIGRLDTPVWVDNWGEWTRRAIVDVCVLDDTKTMILQTAVLDE